MGNKKDGKGKKGKGKDSKRQGGKEESSGPKIGKMSEKDEVLKREGKAEDHYNIGAELGRGGMSVVYEGICKKNGDRWAVKFIDMSAVDELEVLHREINILTALKHPNILRLREVFETPEQIQLVTELVAGGELFEKIVEVGSYGEADAASIVKQVCDGVAYLHSMKVAHRDLKPENLLVGGDETDYEIKIADFGLSKAFGGTTEKLVTSCGTPDYVAPEVLRGEEYDKSVDMWSIGVITYILLCGFPPFWGESQGELFDKILSVDYDFPDPEWSNISSAAKDFIKSLLVKDPNERFDSKQALEHPWLNQTPPSSKERGNLKRLESVKKLEEYNKKRKEANKAEKK